LDGFLINFHAHGCIVDDEKIDKLQVNFKEPSAGRKFSTITSAVANEPLEDFFPIGMFQINRHGAFAGILREKRRAHEIFIQRGIGAQLPREIAGAGNFDLDHVRAGI
jgi:hypothetical protein